MRRRRFLDQVTSGPFGLPYTNSPMTYRHSVMPTYFSLYRVDPNTGQRTSMAVAIGPCCTPGQSLATALPPNVFIAPTDGVADDTTHSYDCSAFTADYQMKWYTLATVDTSQGGSYIINVNTCLGTQPNGMPAPSTRAQDSVTGNGLPNCEGTEFNNFALRAVTTTGTSTAVVST